MRILIVLFCLCICMPGANAQTLKSGDSLSISVLQDSKLARNVVVDPSGEIAFPLAGEPCRRRLPTPAPSTHLESTWDRHHTGTKPDAPRWREETSLKTTA